MTEWQPIETAPLDGTQVDLHVRYYIGGEMRVPECFWRGGAWQSYHRTAYHEYPYPVGGEPLHWLAIPPFPQEPDHA